MIARIVGKLVWVEDNAVGVELAGPCESALTYEVMVPRFLAQRLAQRSNEKPISLWTRQHLESVGTGNAFIPRLIGFTSPDDRRFFELFTSVKGVGARKALKAMAIEPAMIARAIASRDARALIELPEIGKRLAETIIAELSGKVDGFLLGDEADALDALAHGVGPATGSTIEPKDFSSAAHEAMAALMALGEPPEQAERRVRLAEGILRQRDTSPPSEHPEASQADAPSADALLAVVFAGLRG